MPAIRKPAAKARVAKRRARIREAEETLMAIRQGQVDGLMVATPAGEGVVMLSGVEHPYRVMVESMREGAVTLVNGGTIVYCNPRFAAMVGEPLESVLGANIEHFVAPQCLDAFRLFMKEAALEGGKAESCLAGAQGQRLSTYLTLSPMKETGALCLLVMDITRLKAAEEKIISSLREKEMLLREVYHRVKNNLQVISSLFRLQGNGAEDERLRLALQASQARVHAMALVHQKLCQSEDLSRIELKDYLEQLIRDLFQTHSMDSNRISWKVEACDAFFGLDTAVPLGLIANELISNALKHAFPEGRSGRIQVALRREDDGALCLRVQDDGVGMPKAPSMDGESSSIGLWIVRTLAAQVMGKVRLDRKEKGMSFAMTFPEPKHVGVLS